MKRLMTGLIAAALTASAWAAEHKIAFHVDQNDPQVMTMMLNNVQNAVNYIQSARRYGNDRGGRIWAGLTHVYRWQKPGRGSHRADEP